MNMREEYRLRRKMRDDMQSRAHYAVTRAVIQGGLLVPNKCSMCPSPHSTAGRPWLVWTALPWIALTRSTREAAAAS
jgi:hypothetical protein